MLTVRLHEYRRVCRQLRWISSLLVLAQTGCGFLFFYLYVTTPVHPLGYLGMEHPRHDQDRVEVLLTSLAMCATGYLWLLLPAWLSRGGIRVSCPRCDRSLSAHRRQKMFFCPDCDQHFDERTVDHHAETSLVPRGEVPYAATDARD
jgi:hypothetical protein